MKNHTNRIILVSALIVPLSCSLKVDTNEKSKPSFVLINIDDLGYSETEPYGSKENLTPNISKLAEEGTLFTSYYSACSLCSPSRAALLTGCYAQRVGLGMGCNNEGVIFPGDSLGINSDEITLAEHLKSAGYTTACIGKWHLGDQPEFLPEKHGFDYYFGLPYSNDMWVNNKARVYPPLPLLKDNMVIDTIDSEKKQSLLCKQYTDEAISFIEQNKSKPFFLYLPHSFIHGPRYPREKFEQESKNPNKSTGGVISEVDYSVGRIMAALKNLGIDENTMVLFISDNGGVGNTANLPLRGHKGTYWEGGFRDPFIVRWPGNIPENKRLDGIVAAMDIYPTIASLAGVPTTKKQVTDGINISDYLTGKTETPPRELFYFYWRNELSAIRYHDWKLFFNGELYNLKEDIGETTDVSAQHPEIVSKINELFEEARKDLGDARLGLNGENCRPSGRKSNLKFIISGKDINGNLKDYWLVERRKR
jgi:arylsulfatase A